ncbi:venom phosphodiesterase 2-like isoform X2 [Lytechinus variegatus]|uniref:venom phosphodiesterase 2-like isoform X2 n=1 Tax=Lytechinus variegatus TaxID=7654 RepID=UPI001BB2114C|nr:venom phosphodiesterase 2-like isoform X2 [Lytechinus variegatus]
MSQRYLESIRNPQPYPASDTDNPPSRARTPVSVGPRNYSTPSNPPSRSRTPASVLELINPKPYPNAQNTRDHQIVKPTAVRGGENPAYYHDDEDKPRSKKLTKTRSTPRGTPAGSDAESRYITAQSNNGYKGGSLSSLNLSLQVADGQPIKKETVQDVEAGPRPAPRTTSIDGREKDHKLASDALGSKPIDTTRSSHPMTSREKKEKMAKTGGRDEEDWDDDEDEVWYKRHEKLLWIVFFIVVFFFALGLGLGLRARATDYTGAFANTAGQECRFSCRNRDRYTQRSSNPLIVFSIDGLPNDLHNYDNDYGRNLKRMTECGVHSRNLVSSFASTTYPNLWTILTGLYPEKHGVISDYIRSSTRSSRIFEPRVSQDNLDENEWYKAKPLWQTAREQGVITASHSWVGNNMRSYENEVRQPINSKPNYYQRYNSVLTPQDMIDTVLKWIDQEEVEKIPQFITVFFKEPGDTIRQYGYNSQQANEALREVDLAIGSLLDTLYSRQDGGCFNMMVVSPSALVNTTCGNNNDNVVFFDQEITDTRGFTLTPSYLNTFSRIEVNSLDAADAFDTNDKLADELRCRIPSDGYVYTRDEMPARFHYSSDMIPNDVFVLMKNMMSFAMSPSNYDQENCRYASDGYDPYGIDTKASFIGFGMSFRQNYTAYEFDTVEIYNLMTKLIGVTGEPNNGTMGALNHMLRTPGDFPTMAMEFAAESNCVFSNEDMGPFNTGCTCEPVNVNDPTAMERGQQVLSVSSGAAARHIPFGAPRLLASANPAAGSSCKLYQSSYVMAYDKTLSISKYASFTLTTGFNTVTMPSNCIITDTRLAIGENPTCNAYGPQRITSLAPNVRQGFLLQPELSVGSQYSGVISSNIIPIYSEFKRDIWDGLIELYQIWFNFGSTQSINIVQGPIYDMNRNGITDPFSLISSSDAWAGQTVVPSHFYIIATRCANDTTLESCEANGIQMNAFILPHNNKGLPDCAQPTQLQDYLREHRASVMDVERMTGLFFFPDKASSENTNTNERRLITLMKSDIPDLWMV